MIVTVFRSRLKPEARDEYMACLLYTSRCV